jgi:hypothetical protein
LTQPVFLKHSAFTKQYFTFARAGYVIKYQIFRRNIIESVVADVEFRWMVRPLLLHTVCVCIISDKVSTQKIKPRQTASIVMSLHRKIKFYLQKFFILPMYK